MPIMAALLAANPSVQGKNNYFFCIFIWALLNNIYFTTFIKR